MAATPPAPTPAPTRRADAARDALRDKLIAARLALPDRLERAVELQSVLRVWLVGRRENAIGAYWPIKGEFDPLPALYRWSEGDPRARRGASACRSSTARPARCASTSGTPAARRRLDAYDIPKPKDTDEFEPQLLIVPCLGFGPGGVRLGYGGGFFARALGALRPRPMMVGVSYTHGFLPMLRLGVGDLPARRHPHRGRRDVARPRHLSRRAHSPRRRQISSVGADLVHRVEVQARRTAGDAAARTGA